MKIQNILFNVPSKFADTPFLQELPSERLKSGFGSSNEFCHKLTNSTGAKHTPSCIMTALASQNQVVYDGVDNVTYNQIFNIKSFQGLKLQKSIAFSN